MLETTRLRWAFFVCTDIIGGRDVYVLIRQSRISVYEIKLGIFHQDIKDTVAT